MNRSLLIPFVGSTAMFLGICSANAASLMHHWTFDVDGSDSVGSANATVESGASITSGSAGQFGEALSLPDTANGAVVPANIAPVLPTSNFTYTAWINQDATNTQGNGTIMGNQADAASRGAWMRADTEGSDGDFFGRMNNGPGALTEGGTITAGVWTHVAMTVSSSTGLTIFVNGISVGNVISFGAENFAIPEPSVT